jgi:hypothetical protein
MLKTISLIATLVFSVYRLYLYILNLKMPFGNPSEGHFRY